MNRLIYVNGDFVPEKEAKVSVFDRGYLYGDGIFEGIRSYNGRVFMLDEHIDRLYSSAKVTMLNIPLNPEEMKLVIRKTIDVNGLVDAYIRVIVSRGVGDLGLDPDKCKKATVVVIASAIALYGKELYEKGLSAMTVATRRLGAEMVNPRIKSLNYLNNILARIEANLVGAPEGIILNNEGYVAECTGENIFLVKDGDLITPPGYAGILKGITRGVVMEIGTEMGLNVKEELFTRYDIYNADECFLTGTAAEVVPVIMVDCRQIGTGLPGYHTKRIIKEFRELTMTTGTLVQLAKAD